MPLFEVGDGRARVVQPARPGADSFAEDVAAILGQHLDVVLGEPALVVHLRSGAGRADLPDVLAIDVHRSPIVVDVVPVLDEAALMATLQRAGAVARLSRRAVAHLFHPQAPERFDAAVRDFLDSVAMSAGEPRRPGMRVVLLCGQVAPQAADTLAFWRARGRLDVVRVGAVLGQDGRRLLSVETLADLGALDSVAERGAEAQGTGPLRPVPNGVLPPDVTQSLPIVSARDLDALHAVIGAEQEAAASPSEVRSVVPRIANPVLVAPRGSAAVVPGGNPTASTPARGGPGVGRTGLADRAFAPGPRPTGSSAAGQASRVVAPVLLPPPPGAVQRQLAEPGRPPGAGLVAEPAWMSGREHSVAALRTREAPGEPPTTRPYVIVPPPPPPPVRRAPDAPPAQSVPAQAALPSGGVLPAPGSADRSATLRAIDPSSIPRLADERDPVAGPRDTTLFTTGERVPTTPPEPHPQLRTLAAATGAPAALVWHRRRRAQRLVAWLRADGLLALSSGELFADPSRAAAVAAGLDGDVDGWRAWRFGDDGPTLQEAVVLVEG
ncbi:MAG: hypothetical protein KJ792_10985 [Actinobacteria bacterium]|nr:hypothetical protein [Actinomycetota bacterium]MCG2802166.1 hypothetical protein [Cellulomonas sp.]